MKLQKRILLLIAILLISLQVPLLAQVRDYYDPVVGLTGTALKSGLHSLISNNTNSSYDTSKEQLFGYVDNHNGLLRCVYTGVDYSVPYGTMPNQSVINCEHTFAQSWFGSAETAKKKSDVHHLFATNSNVNSSRGNLPFDIVTNVGTTYPSDHGYVSKRGTNSAGQTVFEPADQHKGNLARALLYFSVRYDMSLNIQNVDQLPRLLQWHVQDPVDAAEIARNNAVYQYQNNRNPFIDHPEFVSMIWGGGSAGATIQFSPASAVVNEDAGTVTLQIRLSSAVTTPVTAQVALTNGDAAQLGGFTTQSISIPANSTAPVSVQVTVTDNNLLDGSRTYVFSIQGIQSTSTITLGTNNQFNLTVIDDDIPTPILQSATDITTNSFAAHWGNLQDVDQYELEYSTSNTFPATSSTTVEATGTSVVVPSLQHNTTYYYHVRAIYNDSPGPFSTTQTIHTESLGAVASDLFISEYVEGSSNNKALEIFNGTGVTVNLNQYAIWIITNGGDWYETSIDFPTNTTLAYGETFVLANTNASDAIKAIADQTASYANWNGNDAVALVKNVSGAMQLLDVVGTSGTDPGTAWAVAGVTDATVNHTLIRKANVVGPNTNWTTSAGTTPDNSEWIVMAQDDISNLGMHTFTPVANDDDTTPAVALPVSVYPNPFQTDLTVDLNRLDKGPVSIDIFNIKGQRVSSQQITNPRQITLQSQNLQQGIYLLRVKQADKQYIQRIVKL